MYKTLLAAVLGLALLAPWLAGGWTPDSTPGKPGRAAARASDDSSGEKPGATPTGTPAPKPGDWEAFVDPEGQIFPSLLLASATIQSPPVRDNEPTSRAAGKVTPLAAGRSRPHRRLPRRRRPRRTCRRSWATRTA